MCTFGVLGLSCEARVGNQRSRRRETTWNKGSAMVAPSASLPSKLWKFVSTGRRDGWMLFPILRFEGAKHENRSLDFVVWFTEQAVRCEVSRVHVVLLFPEDLGGDNTEGPSSLWCMQEIRDLDGLHEARRGAGFLCQLAGVERRRPLGILCNLPALQQELYLGWPAFSQVQELLEHTGPLRKLARTSLLTLPWWVFQRTNNFSPQAGLCLESLSGGVCLQPSGTVQEQFPSQVRRISGLFQSRFRCLRRSSSSLYSDQALEVSRSRYSTPECVGDFCSLEAQGDLWRFWSFESSRPRQCLHFCRLVFTGSFIEELHDDFSNSPVRH